MRRLIVLLALMATAAAIPSADAGELIDATNPEGVLEVIRTHGDAALTKDAMGDPQIDGRIGDKDYRLTFYDCSRARDCKSVMFSANWEAEDLTDEMMTKWNREKRFGKAYLDEDGQATVEMNVNLQGGVTRANLKDTIDWWQLILAEFPKYHHTPSWQFW